jgi:type IV secretion system protein VirB11
MALQQTDTSRDPRASTLLRYLNDGLGEFLNDPTCTEVAVNYPGLVFTEGPDGWRAHERPRIDKAYCMTIATATAGYRKQKLSEENPLLSGTLPNGERIQIVMPPASGMHDISLTIRRPGSTRKMLSDYESDGTFADTICEFNSDEKSREGIELTPGEQKLWDLFLQRRFSEFLALAVRAEKKNIIVAGATGSGKTTLMKALVDLIDPSERLITIEDTPEMDLPLHPNRVHLFYTKGDQGVSNVKAKDCLESCLRMKPDRILLSELRSDEAYYYLRNVNSGHPGSLTSIHADSAFLTFTQLMLILKDTRSGGGMSNAELYALLYSLVDIVAHFKFDPLRRKRVCTGIYFDPYRKRMAIRG